MQHSVTKVNIFLLLLMGQAQRLQGSYAATVYVCIHVIIQVLGMAFFWVGGHLARVTGP